MSDPNVLEQFRQMQEQMNALQHGRGGSASAPPGPGGLSAPGTSSAAGGAWGNSTPMMAPTGLLVPVEVETPIGVVSVYLQFPSQAAGRILETLEEVAKGGFKLRAFQPRQQGNWGGGSRGGFGNGGWRR